MFHYPIGILPADIDHMGHVNNSVYLKWVQEAVVRYWEKIAPAEAVAGHLWVALKHEISYRRPAFLEDNVVADVIAEVKSTWCCLDATTRKPARLASDITDRFIAQD
jgi:acyl-CoA thioester hydrolase